MASEWVLVGGDDRVRVHRSKTGGTVSITLLKADPPRSLYMTAAEAALAGELLGRAAMPGQPLPEAAPTREEVDRCGYSEDPYHRCRVCYDYAAGRERDHALTVAAAGPAAMEALRRLADAVQEAGDE